MNVPIELVDDIARGKTILFAGAGLSMGLGLPSWATLIDSFAQQIGFDPHVFSSLGDYLQLAEFYKLEQGTLGTLRSQWDRAWHDPKIKIEDSPIHKMVVDLPFPAIYTTNYDRWIENAFTYYRKPYFKIVTARHLAEAPAGVTHIIKFHGDFDADESLVLTESDYFDRLDFESPLDLRLRSDVLGRSVLFVGYSLADINLRLLFYKLTKMWLRSGQAHARPRSYLFMSAPNVVQQRVLLQRGIEVLSSDEDDPSVALRQFLAELSENVTAHG